MKSTFSKKGFSPVSTSEMAIDPETDVVSESSVMEPEVSPVMTAESSTAVIVRSICCVVVPPASSVTVTVN